MVTSTRDIKKASELLAQCKQTVGGCGAVKFKDQDGKEHWQHSIGEFQHIPHQQCFSCKKKREDTGGV